MVTNAPSGERTQYELEELVATSRALSSERDIKKLLAVILEKCRQVTGADAGSVYVIEEEGGSEAEYKAPPKKVLHFMLSQNDSTRIRTSLNSGARTSISACFMTFVGSPSAVTTQALAVIGALVAGSIGRSLAEDAPSRSGAGRHARGLCAPPAGVIYNHMVVGIIWL